jgi:hypothetical protein
MAVFLLQCARPSKAKSPLLSRFDRAMFGEKLDIIGSIIPWSISVPPMLTTFFAVPVSSQIPLNDPPSREASNYISACGHSSIVVDDIVSIGLNIS